MPAAIVAVAAGAAATVATGWAVGAGLVVAGGIGASIIGAVASTVVGSVLSSALTPSRQDTQQQTAVQAASGIQVNAESQSSPLYTVYGETRIGGTRMVIGASGTNNEYLHLIVAHCEGEVYAAPTLYIGDLPYTDSKFDGLIHWEFFTGADDQQVCQTLLNAGVGWKATSRGRGVAYSYVRLKYKQDAFSGIPQITVKLRGRIVFDPRSNARAWSENPALCLRDYLINPRFGRGIPLELIDETYSINAANTCDSTYADTSGAARKLHTCNGVTNPDTSTLENVRGMMTTCRGRLVYSARGYSLIVDKARVSTFAFTPDNIVGAWSITLPGKRTMRNKVVGAWVNPDDLYKEDLYPAESTEFRALDNGVMLESRIELPFTQNSFEAQMLCERELRQSRIGIQVSFRAFMSALTCEVGDVVTITHDTPGWTAKPFDVTRITLLSDDEVQVDCREYDSVIYDPHVLTAPRTTYTTLLPNPQLVPAFTGLSLSSGTDVLQVMPDGTIISRIKVEWPAPTQIYLDDGQVEVQFKLASSPDWMSLLSHVSTTSVFISPAVDGDLYDVRARWVNEFNRRGAWQTLQHEVIGKREPPPDVLSLLINGDVLTWSPVVAVDLAGYEVRMNYGINRWWESAAKLHSGVITESPYKLPATPSGECTIMVCAVDTTGNYSTNPAVITVVLAGAIVENVIESYPQHTAWTGTKTNCSVVSGELAADETDLFYGADSESFYGADTAYFYESARCLPLTYEFSVLTPKRGRITIDKTIAATTHAIEYQLDNQGAFYGVDTDLFYGADGGLFYGEPSPWTPFIGAVELSGAEEIRFRLTAGGGSGRDIAHELTVNLDVPDVLYNLDDVITSSAGTRLALPEGGLTAIKNTQITVQSDGNGGVTARVIDKNASLGALVQVLNTSGTPVTGLIDATIQGY